MDSNESVQEGIQHTNLYKKNIDKRKSVGWSVALRVSLFALFTLGRISCLFRITY